MRKRYLMPAAVLAIPLFLAYVIYIRPVYLAHKHARQVHYRAQDRPWSVALLGDGSVIVGGRDGQLTLIGDDVKDIDDLCGCAISGFGIYADANYVAYGQGDIARLSLSGSTEPVTKLEFSKDEYPVQTAFGDQMPLLLQVTSDDRLLLYDFATEQTATRSYDESEGLLSAILLDDGSVMVLTKSEIQVLDSQLATRTAFPIIDTFHRNYSQACLDYESGSQQLAYVSGATKFTLASCSLDTFSQKSVVNIPNAIIPQQVKFLSPRYLAVVYGAGAAIYDIQDQAFESDYLILNPPIGNYHEDEMVRAIDYDRDQHLLVIAGTSGTVVVFDVGYLKD